MKRTILFFFLGLVVVPSVAIAQVIFPNRGGTGNSTAPTTGQVLVGQADGTYAPQATSTLGITGALGNNTVTPDFVLTTGQTDEYCLTYEATGSTWEWQACSNAATGVATTSIDTEAELESILTDVTNLITDNDDTDDLTEGVTNLFYTDARVSTYLTGDTGITETGGGISFDCSEVEGVGINCVGESITLDATGDWTGTLDGYEAAALLDNTNLTEEQVEDFVGGMLGGTETLITVTYQDSTNDIDFVVDNDLSNYDNTTSAFLTNITGESIESLSDVTSFTQASGDLFYYNGSNWDRFPIGSNGDVLKVDGGALSWGTDLTSSGGSGLATSTAIADTYVIYGTSAGTVGAEAAFSYDDATNQLTVGSIANHIIGTDIQAYDADLDIYAGITPSANVQSLLGAANYAAMRTQLDLEPGTDFYSIAGADAAFEGELDNSAGLRAALSDEVGTGAAYFVGGALGTPASGNASNLTALNASQLTSGTIPAARVGTDHIDSITEIASALKDGTGACSSGLLCLGGHTHAISTDITGLGTGVATFLGTPSSANLASAVTGETGSGALVFGTSPTLTTPSIATNFTFDSVTVTGLTGADANIVTGTAGASGNCAEWDANGDLVDAGAECGTGSGGGGGNLSTTTEKVGPGASSTVSYVTDEFLLGGSASTSAEFLFDYTNPQFQIRASTSDATTTILSADDTESVRIGEGDEGGDDQWIIGEGVEFDFGTAGDWIARALGSVAEFVVDMALTVQGTFTIAAGNNLVFDSQTFDSFTDDATLTNNAGDLRVVDVNCTGCLSATELDANSVGASELSATAIESGDIESGDLPADGYAATYLNDDGDTGTGVFDFGGATSFEIPNGAGNTVNADGEIAFDTTDDQLIVGADADVIRTQEKIFSFTLASTSQEFVSGGEIPVPLEKDGYTVTNIKCYVQGGTSVQLTLTDNTNAMDTLTCATTATTDDGTIANATVTADEIMYVDVGTITGSPDYVTFSVFGNWTRE